MKYFRVLFNVAISMAFLFSIVSCEKLFNKPPEISGQAFSVEETSPVGTVIGTVVATDASGQEITFSIVSGNDDEAFALSEESGELILNKSGVLNYKIARIRGLIIEIQDEFGKAAKAAITINVLNMPPVIDPQQFSVKENSLSATQVGRVAASDSPNQFLAYRIVSGNEDNTFSISTGTGIITVSQTGQLDYESETTRNIVVAVTDEFGITSESPVTINIENEVPTTDGMILYMPFNETTNDLSSSSNNGINYTSSNYVDGKWGKALDFNGTSDYVQLTNTLNGSTGLTFSFWMKSRGAQPNENNGTVICKYDKTWDYRCFYVLSFGSHATNNINKLGAYFYTDRDVANWKNDMCMSHLEESYLINNGYNTSLYTLNNCKFLELNTWTHCVVNVTATSVEIWLNGELCTKKTREYTAYFETSMAPTIIGNCLAGGDGSNNHFNGVLDEFRVYNRGLTPEEIRILFKE